MLCRDGDFGYAKHCRSYRRFESKARLKGHERSMLSFKRPGEREMCSVRIAEIQNVDLYALGFGMRAL